MKRSGYPHTVPLRCSKCNSSVIRRKSESQNGGNKKTKQAKFSEKRTFLTPPDSHTYVRVSVGKTCLPKTWFALFSCYFRFKIRPFVLLLSSYVRTSSYPYAYVRLLTHTYVRVSVGKTFFFFFFFFGKFGLLCFLVTFVLRFALLSYSCLLTVRQERKWSLPQIA